MPKTQLPVEEAQERRRESARRWYWAHREAVLAAAAAKRRAMHVPRRYTRSGLVVDNSTTYSSKIYGANRERALEFLGGKCVSCGFSEFKPALQIDHIDPLHKNCSVTGLLYKKAWEPIEDELKKCQLLCANCHIRKTKEYDDYNRGRARSASS